MTKRKFWWEGMVIVCAFCVSPLQKKYTYAHGAIWNQVLRDYCPKCKKFRNKATEKWVKKKPKRGHR